MGEWLYYNCAAGNFHTKEQCSRVDEIEFYLLKITKIAFWATLWGT